MFFLSLLSIRKITVILFLLFFFFGLGTLTDYGINWDTINHLPRGQAYLHYFLTGEKDYTNLGKWNLFREKEALLQEKTAKEGLPRYRLYFQDVDSLFYKPDLPRSEIPRISMYQNVDNDFGYFMKHDGGGHPPLSDILSSVFNLVLFQKLGLINDVDAYRVYGVFLSSLLVGLVFWWAAKYYGKFSGVLAALSLVIYPLFLSEFHFNNEKDIPETVYWSFMLFAVWRGVVSRSWRWLLVSGIFFGLGLGTKFNILFSVFVIVPWLVVYLISRYLNNKVDLGRVARRYTHLVVAALTSPVIGFLIFVGSWPYLWLDPVSKIGKVINFYREIGVSTGLDLRFLGPLGTNTYALQWILYTTPLIILFLVSIGLVVVGLRLASDRDSLGLLFLLWLIVPIARVTWPGANIYGGVRQIMEYIPAFAIMAGIGAGFFQNWISSFLTGLKIGKQKATIFASCLVFALFIPIAVKLIRIHPNENVYFNPLIGGLQGASERDFPSWGYSFGAPYRDAIKWMNKNAEQGAKLTLEHGLLINIPAIFIRPDLDYKDHRSGYLQRGEYVISLNFQGTDKFSYVGMYLNNMVEPVYQVFVDSVPILKIWKNDREYLKPEWKDEAVLENIAFEQRGKGLFFDIGRVVKLSRLELLYDESGCEPLSWGYLMISQDGEEWERVPGVLPEELRIKVLGKQPKDGKLIEPFAGQEARYVNFFVSPVDACITQIESTRLYYFVN